MNPRDQAIEAILGNRELGQSSAQDHRYLMGAITLELGLEVPRCQCCSPPKLDDVDELAGYLNHAVHLRDRQPAVDHVRYPVSAWLDAACREV